MLNNVATLSGQSSLSTLLEMISFDRSHTSSYLHSIVTKATSCIVSKIKQHIGGKSEFFIPPSTPQSHGEKAGNIFALFFSQRSQITGLSGGVNGLCKKSSTYSAYTHITDR